MVWQDLAASAPPRPGPGAGPDTGCESEVQVPGVEVDPPPLFHVEGRRYVPTLLTTGPWRPDAMHGGAPGALIGALVAGAVKPEEQVAAVSIDLERPVPLEPLGGEVRRRQVSRRIAHLEVDLATESGRAVGARAVLLHRLTEVDVPLGPPGPGPQGLKPEDWTALYPPPAPSFVRDAIEHRVVHGGYGAPLPSGAWLRLRGPVLDGEEPDALAQLLAVADFGSPLGQTGALGPGLALINIDINVSVFRPPVGPWFFLDAVSHVGPGGIGLAVTEVADCHGPLGVITQSQLPHRYAQPGGGGR
jgi:hypothetical protein